MPTLAEIIAEVDTLKPNAYTLPQKMVWLNKVDEEVKLNVLQVFKTTNIQRLADTESYSLPVGVDFSSIRNVFMDGKEITRIDRRSHGTFYRKEEAYFNDDGDIGISPIPSTSDTVSKPLLAVIYLEKFTPYTATSETLLITNEHKIIYTWYLMAMMAFFDQDYDVYNNIMMQYNSAYKDFESWNTRSQPTNKNLKARNLW